MTKIMVSLMLVSVSAMAGIVFANDPHLRDK
jgi:hypothetical protein